MTGQASPEEMAKDLQRRLGGVIARTWSDEAFKARLIADPAATLKAEGIPLAEGVRLTMVEDTATHVHMILPPKPSEPVTEQVSQDPTTNELQQRLQRLAAKAGADDTYKARLIAEPAAALKAEGIALADGMTLTVLENTATDIHMILPPKPSGALSDNDLESVSGGTDPLDIAVGVALVAIVGGSLAIGEISGTIVMAGMVAFAAGSVALIASGN